MLKNVMAETNKYTIFCVAFRGNRGKDNLVLLIKIDGCRFAENQLSSAF